MQRKQSNGIDRVSARSGGTSGELAALAVLFAVSAALGPKKRRRMQRALRQLDADWSRPDASDPASGALQASAKRFAAPASAFLSPAPPRPPIKR